MTPRKVRRRRGRPAVDFTPRALAAMVDWSIGRRGEPRPYRLVARDLYRGGLTSRLVDGQVVRRRLRALGADPRLSP